MIMKHAVPNALHTIVAYQGTVLPYMMRASWRPQLCWACPPWGRYSMNSLVNQDIYISGSLLLMYGALILLGNLLADIFLAVLDPRIRYS